MKIRKVFSLNPKMNLQRLALLCMAVALIGTFTGCATFRESRPEPVTVPQIISMVKQGMPSTDIIAQMKASRTVYRLKASHLADLEKQGVPADIIDYMQKTYLQAVKAEARYQERRYWTMADDYCWYGGAPFGWPCDDCYDDDGV